MPYSRYNTLTSAYQADWSDVIQLTDVLNNAPDELCLRMGCVILAHWLALEIWLSKFYLYQRS